MLWLRDGGFLQNGSWEGEAGRMIEVLPFLLGWLTAEILARGFLFDSDQLLPRSSSQLASSRGKQNALNNRS